MKTTFEITKEQILELAEKQSGRRAKLKQWFPQAFQSELKTGKWYKSNLFEEKLYCFTKFEQCDGYVKRYYYGFSEDVWRLDYTASNELDESWTLATDKEVETALIAEAKRRGFEDGVLVKSFIHNKTLKIKKLKESTKYISEYDKLHFGCDDGYCVVVFENGKWAEICEDVKDLRVEEIQNILGYKIRIVE